MNKGILLFTASAGLMYVIFMTRLFGIGIPNYTFPLAAIGLLLSYPLYKLDEWLSK